MATERVICSGEDVTLGSVGDCHREWKEGAWTVTRCFAVFESHREAEAARDIDAILETFVTDCFLETTPLGLRSEGKAAVKAAYEQQFFTAFPDLAPEDEAITFNDDAIAVWGTLRGTSRGDWLGIPPGGGTFAVPFAKCRPVPAGADGRREDLLRPRDALCAGSASTRGSSGSRGRTARRDLDAFAVGSDAGFQGLARLGSATMPRSLGRVPNHEGRAASRTPGRFRQGDPMGAENSV
jgi:predicted ester cyclase